MRDKTRSLFEYTLKIELGKHNPNRSNSFIKDNIKKAKSKFSSVLGSGLVKEAKFYSDDFSDLIFINIGEVELALISNSIYYMVPNSPTFLYVDGIAMLAELVLLHQRDYAKKILLDDNL